MRPADQGRRPPCDASRCTRGVGDPPDVDVGEFPHGLVEEVLGGYGEPFPPVHRHGGDGTGPQVGEARLHGIGGLREAVGQVHGHEGAEPVEVGLGTRAVLGALVHLQEVVVEEEHPHVPVGDQGQRFAVAVGVGVGAQQGVVVRVEVALLPDAGTFQHPEGAGPLLGVGPGVLQVGVQSRRIRHIEIRQLERLRHGRVDLSSVCLADGGGRPGKGPSARDQQCPTRGAGEIRGSSLHQVTRKSFCDVRGCEQVERSVGRVLFPPPARLRPPGLRRTCAGRTPGRTCAAGRRSP